ncbi:MAG: hypothetical protein DMG96_36525 [Acidobacteria bacterium]|nr:MAG: hypothetical protein DMG96_36525 [Acidobacteriota bacterium]
MSNFANETMTPGEKALELWAKEIKSDGIWTSANDFPTEEAANLFVKWLEGNGYAHQGIHKHISKECWNRLKATGVDSGEQAWSVRFR